MDCRGGSATLRSCGGAVAVDSLDGNLQVDSGGGAVQASWDCVRLLGLGVRWRAAEVAGA